MEPLLALLYGTTIFAVLFGNCSVRVPKNTQGDAELGRESDGEESTSGGRVQTRKINN